MNTRFEAIVKKRDNTLYVDLPQSVGHLKNIRPNHRIALELISESQGAPPFQIRDGVRPYEKKKIPVIEPSDVSHLFGTLRAKMTGQEFKELVRKGWK